MSLAVGGLPSSYRRERGSVSQPPTPVEAAGDGGQVAQDYKVPKIEKAPRERG